MAIEDRRALAQFVRDLQFVVQALVSNGTNAFRGGERFQAMSYVLENWTVERTPFTLLPGWLAEVAEPAWTEVREGLPALIESLTIEGNEGLLFDQQLQTAGLTGPQLNLKLTAFHRAIANFTQDNVQSMVVVLPLPPFVMPRWIEILQERGGRLMWAMRRLFWDILRWADIPLGTLASIHPGFEAFKELKEELELSQETPEP